MVYRTNVKSWCDAASKILKQKDKLRDDENVFIEIYYGVSKKSISYDDIQSLLDKLKKIVDHVVDLDLRNHGKTFLTYSKQLYKPENIVEFRKILNENGWMPVDPEEQERIRREKEARIRAEREAQEREIRRLREERRRKWRKTRNNIFRCIAICFIIFGLVKGIPIYRYRHTEYKALIVDAETHIANNRYDDAIKALRNARDRKSSAKKIDAINERIAEVQSMKNSKILQLNHEIKTILNTFKTASFKYGRPENDFKKTQEKINQLKSLSNSADCDKYQAELDYIRKRKI